MKYFWVCILFSLSLNISAQPTNDKIDALNEYVNFTNESIHGMLIVHRLLENYNQEINKYVDLDSYVLNNFSNSDLPNDIFEDPENWFYDISPREWKAKTDQNNALPSSLRNQLNGLVGKMQTSTSNINELRKTIERLTKNDLTQRTELGKVYEKLEEGVTFYENFYQHQQKLERLILNYYNSKLKNNTSSQENKKVLNTLSKVYNAQHATLVNLRAENHNAISDNAQEVAKAKGSFIQELRDIISKKHTRQYSNILNRINATQAALSHYENDLLPIEYNQYGKFYYYYNSQVINQFNRYGNGSVFEMNVLIKKMNIGSLFFFELPHFYKVIYPRKIEKIEKVEDKKALTSTSNKTPNAKTTTPKNQNDKTESSTPSTSSSSPSKVTYLPTEVEGRKVKSSNRTVMMDGNYNRIKIRIYDHMLQDGDRVSINFNNEWIVKDHLLTKKPKVLDLKLDPSGRNFLVLHAETLGIRPPNTMALIYKYHGKTKQIILESDLNESELIEIFYEP